MLKKLLVTGGGGFLGANILMQAEHGLALHAIDQLPVMLERENLTWHSIDLQDRRALQDIFLSLEPDAVIHTAAISDIDYCEANPEKADAVNVGVTLNVAELCRRTGARLVFFSSDSVFDGRRGRYRESDTPEPLNQYARTKVKAEKGIEEILANHIVVRPSLIMGIPVLRTGNSFLWRMIQSLRNGRQVALPKTEIRSPVDVLTLSRAAIEIAGNSLTGVLHIAGNESLSRYDMGRRIALALGYPVELVVDTQPEVAGGRAPRPADASLDNGKAKRVLKTPMKDFDEAMKFIIANKGDREL